MKKPLIFIFLLAFTFTLAGVYPAWGQSYADKRQELLEKQDSTRARIERLSSQIEEYEERIALAEEKYDRLSRQYENLEHLIALQEDKITNLQAEQKHIQEEMDVIQQEISTNQEKLDKLVENYKETLTHVYKYGRSTELALLFSSGSINQMLVRSHYLQQFKEYREQQAEEIRETQKQLKQNREQLEQARQRNDELLTEIRAEKDEYESKKDRQARNVTLLKNNVEEIRDQKEKVEEQIKNFNNTITQITAQLERFRKQEEERKRNLAKARAIENDAERARAVARYSEPVARAGQLGQEELQQIEAAFAQDKGRLPWPVNSRTISEHFGNKRHPVYGTITPNLGIEIVTDRRAPVRVVHDGYVVDVLPLTGYGDVVLVSHGRYITVYGNLSEVIVQKGTILQKGDVVGLSGDEDSPKGTSVFFMVRESNTNLDPENWLAKN